MSSSEVVSKLSSSGLSAFSGYPKTGSLPPYVVVRPMSAEHTDVALSGTPVAYDTRVSAYCVASSVEASWNLSTRVSQILNGTALSSGVAVCSIGYAGALVEGRYETQVTIQLDQGELS